MIRKCAGALLTVIILAEVAYLICAYIHQRQMDSFTCAASLVQHYQDEVYYLSLNYTIRGNFGLVHITGRSDVNPEKIFNRKISFNLQRNGDIYYMLSDKNIKLPDDSFDDEELSLYVPRFFIKPGKDIYIRILKQNNNNFVFMVDSIPTYICKNTARDS
ncbi:FidL-like putative membrane protein [Candidatus Pantoea varia]|uniref:FidL-like putative membrane protein n=1 Tax=Candidatus Pantoea varia TaxID=1881036 RepID=A0A1I5HU40_9GAMM|nr:hypothetical protein [Pantoea varia]SFO51864.1 FidL-like putative membrane protein [Pantoea varia]